MITCDWESEIFLFLMTLFFFVRETDEIIFALQHWDSIGSTVGSGFWVHEVLHFI